MLAPSLLLVVGGLIALYFAANWLVAGSVALARRLGVGELIIGLTIVALGTSAPELVTGIKAALAGAPGIVLGNAVGSNIANLGLVLGAAALFRRIPVGGRIAWQDGPIMLLLTAVTFFMLRDGILSRLEGGILVALLLALTYFYIRRGKARPEEISPKEAIEEMPMRSFWPSLGLLLLGIAGLVAGAWLLVDGATAIARLAGVSDLVIGATVVAFGTSVPELAASLVAVQRKAFDLVLGNLIGSCQMNLVAILGIPALITPLAAEPNMLTLHLPAMAAISLIAWFMLIAKKGRTLRREGALLVVLYITYIGLTVWLS